MSIEAEQSLLGAILLGNREFHVAPVEPRDFTTEEHRKIYQAISELLKDGLPADVVSVGERLGADPPKYLAALVEETATAENEPHYARIIRDRAERQRLVLRTTACALDANAPLEQTKETIMQALMDGTGHQEAKPFDQAVEELEHVIREMLTGIETFDHETGGFHGERMIVFGGPACTKPALPARSPRKAPSKASRYA